MVKRKIILSTLLLGLVPLSNAQQVLSPEPKNTVDVDKATETEGLYVGDSLICNDRTCYPKVFEADDEWRVVKPLQRLPGGLDIRINFDTKLKEARLLPAGVKPVKQEQREKEKKEEQLANEETATSAVEKISTSVSSITSETKMDTAESSTSSQKSLGSSASITKSQKEKSKETASALKENKKNELAISRDTDLAVNDSDVVAEDADISAKSMAVSTKSTQALAKDTDTAIKDTNIQPNDATDNYEFTKEFKVIRDIYNKKARLTNSEIKEIEAKLEELMEFTHDYKHGMKIITHEFELLKSISLSDKLPVSLRELSTRAITGCLRNNPPVLEFICVNHKEFPSELFQWLSTLQDKSIDVLNLYKTLIKRYISILDEILSSMPIYDMNTTDLESLTVIYESLDDPKIKTKVLELVSRFFSKHIEVITIESGDEPSIKKRNEQVVQDVQKWTDELATSIQDKNNDEMHIRKFFNGLYQIKSHFKNDIKVDNSFLNWLAKETELRKPNKEKSEEKDSDQDYFDSLLVSSRHLIFGNELAHNLKHDEL
ncbi:hypothetical protein TPHA_0H02570 [Tetrapisispora phaffii CBS 4417]|uniref:Nucleotide exchange factor SIL1 n=1 Tax=Tetrapisispora phaffii (strain ATCC 24235 / CBS 4417 / NBRC 1672 / NRRL Y-8282 / UCD 70-5) TaxID=1071381 RepID=G8BWK9_TETPH|nr:hypothetical protein TPHA_0H02570 [Tetrapisispora phaffii CBS 4417]CCE64460.1 hypothetical protein TPHA_0H02570 [Tetrapisispora phaffii CBS 4417]